MHAWSRLAAQYNLHTLDLSSYLPSLQVKVYKLLFESWVQLCSREMRAVTFQQTRTDLNIPTSCYSPVTLTPFSHKQSINMLFQLMMGKSMWEFSPPCSTRTSLPLQHFSGCLWGPLVSVENIFKDGGGCDWMERLMTNKNMYRNRRMWMLFDFYFWWIWQKGAQDGLFDRYHLQHKKKGVLRVESSIFHLHLLT